MFAHVFRLVSYLEVYRPKIPNAFLIAPHACCVPNDSVPTPVIILILLGDVPEIRRSPLFNFLDDSAATSPPSRYNPHLIKDGVSKKSQDKMVPRHCLLLSSGQRRFLTELVLSPSMEPVV